VAVASSALGLDRPHDRAVDPERQGGGGEDRGQRDRDDQAGAGVVGLVRGLDAVRGEQVAIGQQTVAGRFELRVEREQLVLVVQQRAALGGVVGMCGLGGGPGEQLLELLADGGVLGPVG
jgi:hypothetical protein